MKHSKVAVAWKMIGGKEECWAGGNPLREEGAETVENERLKAEVAVREWAMHFAPNLCVKLNIDIVPITSYVNGN